MAEPAHHGRDRLGGGERAGRYLERHLAVAGLAAAHLAEDGQHAPDLLGHVARHGQVERQGALAYALGDDGYLLVDRVRQRQHDDVEAPLQCGGQFVHALVAVVGRRDHVEAALGIDRRVELGDRHHLFGKDRNERVLYVRAHARQLLQPAELSLAHGTEERCRDQSFLARPVREKLSVVPAVADLVLVRSGGALDDHGGVARNGGRQMLRHPRLGRARHAQQQQCAIGGERGDGRLYQAARADILGADLGAVRSLAAQQVSEDGLRRHRPAFGALPLLFAERLDLSGVSRLGGRAKGGGVGLRSGHAFTPSCAASGRAAFRRSRARSGSANARPTPCMASRTARAASRVAMRPRKASRSPGRRSY